MQLPPSLPILFWVADSPFARIAKWRLLAEGVAHTDHLLTWATLHTDLLFLQHSAKGQVPVLLSSQGCLADSLRISSSLLTDLKTWNLSDDSLLYRTSEFDFAFIMNTFYQFRSFEKNGMSAAILEPRRAELRDYFLKLFNTTLPWAQKSLCLNQFGTTSPGLVAFHVFVGFVAYFSPEIKEQVVDRMQEISSVLEATSAFQQLSTLCGPPHSLVPTGF